MAVKLGALGALGARKFLFRFLNHSRLSFIVGSAAAASYLSDKIKLVTGAGKQYVLFDYNMCLLTTEIVT